MQKLVTWLKQRQAEESLGWSQNNWDMSQKLKDMEMTLNWSRAQTLLGPVPSLGGVMRWTEARQCKADGCLPAGICLIHLLRAPEAYAWTSKHLHLRLLLSLCSLRSILIRRIAPSESFRFLSSWCSAGVGIIYTWSLTDGWVTAEHRISAKCNLQVCGVGDISEDLGHSVLNSVLVSRKWGSF